ncbi:dihydroxyacetone kinase phosphoryl donor subunit DhaM [Acerihabitans arboris]|uniref:phosphoenolpyruvate--glycerone phosphotransferase n=1 Tax=Acerihabitans arboris TaxID=2691583 RepID=A0A845SFP1_9GAMM|nr:dihydroxyacetone kinase phosphoryl donor subunit DhaM [Acerihabitans arboris]NDL63853.1 HPr family phosphocarrier protein [Acerihabitans arboris]
MVNIVVVSHSLLLAQGVAQLAEQMIQGGCRLAIAAGVDDEAHPIGTDAVKVMEAIASVDDPAGVLVLMDLGSALLSAETALELLDRDMAQRVRLCAAPLVEGTLAAVVAASAGGDLPRVTTEALGALAAKARQLGEPADQPAAGPATPVMPADGQSVSWKVLNPNGLHVRPAAQLAGVLAPFKADLLLQKEGRGVDPRSLNQLATLQVRQGDTIRLLASGPEAQQALDAFSTLARRGFGEHVDARAGMVLGGIPVPPGGIRAPVLKLRPARYHARSETISRAQVTGQQQRLRSAMAATRGDLRRLAHRAGDAMGPDQAAIFSAHALLIEDEDLLRAFDQRIARQLAGAEAAVQHELLAMAGEYLAMEDPYLRARELDIRDILNRVLGHLGAGPVAPLSIGDGDGVLLVAEELMPSEMIGLERQKVKGICLSEGNIWSHSAILARAQGIPMVVGVSGCMQATRTGQMAALDMTTGSLTVDKPAGGKKAGLDEA